MIPVAELYGALGAAYGPQQWWPGEGAFEIIVGALLVQRTTWRGAATAIEALAARGLVDPESLSRADPGELEACIRSAGFYRTKAARLGKLASFVVAEGGIAALAARPTPELRALLLDLEGIGPETADAILLYAFERPAVVVDAYLRRLAQRLGASAAVPGDTELRRWVGDGIGSVADLNEFHALVVAHGKRVCGARPRCAECAIVSRCRTGSGVARADGAAGR